jgi:hypothetical protein
MAKSSTAYQLERLQKIRIAAYEHPVEQFNSLRLLLEQRRSLAIAMLEHFTQDRRDLVERFDYINSKIKKVMGL